MQFYCFAIKKTTKSNADLAVIMLLRCFTVDLKTTWKRCVNASHFQVKKVFKKIRLLNVDVVRKRRKVTTRL